MDQSTIQSPVVETLLKRNFEFKKLYVEHETMEEKLRRLDARKALTEEEEHERKQIQKMKLSGKDRMYAIIREASNGRAR